MSKTLKHEIKSEALLEKGMMILWSKGYNATSVNDIVKEAGIPKGSFYFYFKSKEDFAVQAIERYFDMNFTPAFEILQQSGVSAKDRLLNFYEFRVQKLKDELQCKMGCLGCNLSNEMSEHNEAIRKIAYRKTQLVADTITEVALEAQAAGDIDAAIDVKNMVAFLEDAGKGAMVTMKEMQDAYPIDNVLQMVRTIFIR